MKRAEPYSYHFLITEKWGIITQDYYDCHHKQLKYGKHSVSFGSDIQPALKMLDSFAAVYT